MVRMNREVHVVACVGLVAVSGCQTALNYPALVGPRYAGGPAAVQRAASLSVPDGLRIVTFNIQWGRRVDRAIELLGSAEPVRGADIVTLQEVDAGGTRRVAEALGMAYVYYPSAVHPKTGRDFGNAVLSRWPIVQDQKIVLPHHGRFRDTERAATVATILVGDDSLRVYSVHLSTMVEVSPTARREQARAVLADAIGYPRVVIGGDMNGVGVGYEFQACGFLWPTKDNGPTISVFTWDHIFLKGLVVKDPTSTGVVANDNGASDHRPVWAVARVLRRGDAGAKQPGSPLDRTSGLEGCAALD